MISEKYKKKVFDKCVDFFMKLQYKVDVIGNKDGSTFVHVKGNGIIAGFCDKSTIYTMSVPGIIFADNRKCFDKWWKCPIQLRIPMRKSEYEYLESVLKWLVTKEGYKASNEYDFNKWIIDYPD